MMRLAVAALAVLLALAIFQSCLELVAPTYSLQGAKP